MDSVRKKDPLLATWLLLFATVFWGTSFIAMKALVLEQQQLAPGANTWLLSSLSLVFRFGLAAMLLVAWKISVLKRMTWLEFYQGLGLGVVGGIGLLLQMDGVNYTEASTSAFLTQCYCIIIPLLVVFRKRQWPSKTIIASTLMVLTGIIILSRVDFRDFRLGRGELETLLASLFFTGQILWLERPLFFKNEPHNVTVVMFVVSAIVFLPIPFLIPDAPPLLSLYSSGSSLVFNLILMIFCTLIAYTLMNYWQPHIEATQAGLIYCSEPVFTSIFGLFLPGWFSIMAGIDYANESLTVRQIVGGGLITGANLLIIYQAARMARKSAQ